MTHENEVIPRPKLKDFFNERIQAMMNSSSAGELRICENRKLTHAMVLGNRIYVPDIYEFMINFDSYMGPISIDKFCEESSRLATSELMGRIDRMVTEANNKLDARFDELEKYMTHTIAINYQANGWIIGLKEHTISLKEMIWAFKKLGKSLKEMESIVPVFSRQTLKIKNYG